MLQIRPEVAAFFKPFYQTAGDGRNLFIYGPYSCERWTPESHIIPSTTDIWLAGAVCPNLISDLYLSYCAAELITFCSQRPGSLLRFPEQHAFAALGLLPGFSQAAYLKVLFPNARWHLLFSPDLLGKITDASIAAWYKGYPVSFRIMGNSIAANYRDKVFRFEHDRFSLHRFELATGMRSGIRTHKPPNGYQSFIALQTANYHDP